MTYKDPAIGPVKTIRNRLIPAIGYIIGAADGIRPHDRAIASQNNEMVGAREDDFTAAIAIEIEKGGRHIHFLPSCQVRKARQALAVIFEGIENPLASGVAL